MAENAEGFTWYDLGEAERVIKEPDGFHKLQCINAVWGALNKGKLPQVRVFYHIDDHGSLVEVRVFKTSNYRICCADSGGPECEGPYHQNYTMSGHCICCPSREEYTYSVAMDSPMACIQDSIKVIDMIIPLWFY